MSTAGKRPERDVTIDTSEMNVLFVHSALDDYPLTPEEFRLYAHLARRAGRGDAYPAVSSMAQKCRMHEDTVRRCLRNLITFKMLEAHERKGRTTLYTLTKFSKWVKPEMVTALHAQQSKVGAVKRAAKKAAKAEAEKAAGTNPPVTKGGVQEEAGNQTPPKRREGYPPVTEGGDPPVTKGGEGNPLNFSHEGGEYIFTGDARAEDPAAPVVELTHAPITTTIAAREEQGGQTPPAMGGQTDTASLVAVVSPDGEAADAAITDAELEFLFRDQAVEVLETETVTEVQEVPGGAAARPGAQEAQEAVSAADLGPHDPEETRAVLVPALGGQKRLSTLMEETPPGLTAGARRGWITRITPERATEVIAAARVEARADNPWTYIIRHLDMELGAQIKRGGTQGSSMPTVTPNGASLHAAVRMEVVEDVAPTDVYAVGARWQARDGGEIVTIARTSLSPVRNGKITLYHLSNGQDLKIFELMGRYDHIGAGE